MKATPKSCSCRTCRYAKGTRPGNVHLKAAERAFRHASNAAARAGKEDIFPATHSGRIG